MKKGRIVKMKSGEIGKTVFYEGKVRGKVIVHLEREGKEIKLLCSQRNLEYIGYYN